MADVLHIKISWDQICRYVNCKVENMPSAATVPKSCLSWICPGVEEDCPRSSNCKFSITTLHQVQSVGQSVGVTNFLNCRNRWLNLLKKNLKNAGTNNYVPQSARKVFYSLLASGQKASSLFNGALTTACQFTLLLWCHGRKDDTFQIVHDWEQKLNRQEE